MFGIASRRGASRDATVRSVGLGPVHASLLGKAGSQGVRGKQHPQPLRTISWGRSRGSANFVLHSRCGLCVSCRVRDQRCQSCILLSGDVPNFLPSHPGDKRLYRCALSALSIFAHLAAGLSHPNSCIWTHPSTPSVDLTHHHHPSPIIHKCRTYHLTVVDSNSWSRHFIVPFPPATTLGPNRPTPPPPPPPPPLLLLLLKNPRRWESRGCRR